MGQDLTHEELERLCDEGHSLKAQGDLQSALDIWQRAAARGSGRALNILGAEAHARGDLAEAKRLFSLAIAADPPDVWAMFNLGVLANQDGDTDLAMHHFEQAGANGHMGGAHNRAQMAKQQQDMKTARYWWQQAAELGHRDAAYNLGILAKKEGDTANARTWFERSAELGHADGMNNLGAALMAEGDLSRALELYERAAEAGSTSAMHNLSQIAEGKYVYVDAITWMKRASDAGDERAHRELSRLQLVAHLELDSSVTSLTDDDLVACREAIRTAAYRTDLVDSERRKLFAVYVRSMCIDIESYRDLEVVIEQCDDPLLLRDVIPNLDSRSSSDDPEHDECVASVLRNPATDLSVLLDQARRAQWMPYLNGTLATAVFRAASKRDDISYFGLGDLVESYLTTSEDNILFMAYEDGDPKQGLLEDLKNAFLEFQESHPLDASDWEDFENGDPWEQIALASHPMTPPPVLRVLAAHENSHVRRFVAGNPSSDNEIRAIAALLK